MKVERQKTCLNCGWKLPLILKLTHAYHNKELLCPKCGSALRLKASPYRQIMGAVWMALTGALILVMYLFDEQPITQFAIIGGFVIASLPFSYFYMKDLWVENIDD